MSTRCMTSRSIYTPVRARSYTFFAKYRHTDILYQRYHCLCICRYVHAWVISVSLQYKEWLVDSCFIYLKIHCSFICLITSPYRFVCVWFPSSIRCKFAWGCQREDIENTLPRSVKLHPSFHPAKGKLAIYNVSKCWGSLPAKQVLKRIHSNHACIPIAIISSMIYLHTNLP